jgi:hypothetical protein
MNAPNILEETRMETTESCRLCEKIVVVLETKEALKALQELPSTYDTEQQKYVWKRSGAMAYAMVPRAVQERTGILDLFLCLDEDMLDDLDILAYANKFFRETVLAGWSNGNNVQLMQPVLSPPAELECWKLRHAVAEGS